MTTPTLGELEEWRNVIAPPCDGPLVMLKVAVDESGTHGGAPCIAVAAVFGDPAHWREFARDWTPIARKHYPNGFHTTEARPEHNAQLAAIVARWLEGFAVTISYQMFDEVVPKRVRSVYGAHYRMALSMMLAVLSRHCEAIGERWMAWVLEDGHRESDAAKQMLGILLAVPELRLYSHTWVGKDNVDTHAADLAAFLGASTRTSTPSPLVDVVTPAITILEMSREELQRAVNILLDVMKREKWQRDKEKAQRARSRRSGR